MLITLKFLLINFQQKRITILDFLILVLDYNFLLNIQKKLLIFYPKLLTIIVKLRLADYQRITKNN